MNLNRWSVVLVSTAGLVACTDAVAPSVENTMNAKWAGSDWAGSVSVVVASVQGGEKLYLWASGPSKPARPKAWWSGPELAIWPNEISIEIPFNGAGTYALTPGSARFQEIVGGDVITATYSIAPQTVGRLVISSYEPGGMIEGVVSFDAVSSNQYRSFGDRASLEDGHFRAKAQLGFPFD